VIAIFSGFLLIFGEKMALHFKINVMTQCSQKFGSVLSQKRLFLALFSAKLLVKSLH
jgi:hypothetical protein